MKTIFISYAREDKDSALSIYNLLKEHDFSPWIDVINILPGQDWQLEIEKAIHNSSIFIACLSANSVSKRGYVQAEFRKALKIVEMLPEGQVFIIPVRLNPCNVPIKFSHIQILDYFANDGPKKLIEAITIYIVVEINSTFLKNKDVTVNSNQHEYFVEITRRPGMRDKVVDYLINTRYTREDPTEHYWIYITLAKIGGKKAKAVIRKGLSDVNEFARLGAQTAWDIIKRRMNKKRQPK